MPHSHFQLNVIRPVNIDTSRSVRTGREIPRLYPHEKFGGYLPPWAAPYSMLLPVHTRLGFSSGKRKKQ